MNDIISGKGVLTLAGGLRYGDQVVFQTEEALSYRIISESLLDDLSIYQGGKLHHLHFHKGSEKLTFGSDLLTLHTVDPHSGFDGFVGGCCSYINNLTSGDVVFIDCLTSLMSFWGGSDWLVGGYAYNMISESMRNRGGITSFTSTIKKVP